MTSEAIQGYIIHMVILEFKNHLFCLTPNLGKTLQECKHYEDANFSLNEV